ncbi:hypothetical protein J3T92_06655 [Bifidobacterium sp. B4081]|uniref:hypothetical protein n=1 Tax=unclassified Bifidobacterium TaxID=2608897 RepID=UPI00226ADBA5|nr:MULTISPECIES: hypothetical protein [unclassified Bifidobacterium]MCX8644602.1 hypothetical protein [Bifidobacterium sp. B4077]MCX8646284.1 hypothetical protein [Bifidobacterium sp. B4081]MCX8667891.1 hypothetical protein [Bifidobacterium sp. B3998]
MKLLEGIGEESLHLPGIFPTEERGMSPEWANGRTSGKCGIDSDLGANAGTGFNVFIFPQGGFTGTDEDTSNLKEAQQFIEKNVAVFQASRPES